MKNKRSLLFSLLIPLLGMGISSYFVNPKGSWYTLLDHPFWSPPPLLFSIIWPVLYILIGYSFWRILILSNGKKKKWAYFAYAIQLTLNISWSFFFFYLESPLLGLINLFLLNLAILWNIYEFSRFSPSSSILLFPYFIWVLYATTLNYGFWRMN